MATLGNTWANSYTGLMAATGTYRAAYRPKQKDGSGEDVLIAGPGDTVRAVKTPSLGGFWLAVENERIVVYYLELPGNVERRVDSGIVCGQPVGATTFGGVGPMGPAGAPGPAGPQGKTGPAGAPGGNVTEDQMQRIAALTAQAVATYPAAPDHFGIAPVEAQSGLWAQDAITVLLSNQAVWQRIIMAIDESVANLVANGYQPKAS